MSKAILTPDEYQNLGGEVHEWVDWTFTGERVWITVKNLSLQIINTGEGVIVDIYPHKAEMSDPLATTYAYFSEAEDET